MHVTVNRPITWRRSRGDGGTAQQKEKHQSKHVMSRKAPRNPHRHFGKHSSTELFSM